MRIDKALQDLARQAGKTRPDGNFSASDVQASFREELNTLVVNPATNKIDYYMWQENSNTVFSLIATALEERVQENVKKQFEMLADIKIYNHGDKPLFHTKTGRKNISRFVTRVAAAGRYERVRMDRTSFTIETYAHGGAVYQSLEDFLTGRGSLNELFDLLQEALENMVYDDIMGALNNVIASLPDANQAIENTFLVEKFNSVLSTIAVYGKPVIVCDRAFAGNLLPLPGFESEVDKQELREQGYIGKYLGADIMILKQAFLDEDNTEKAIPSSHAYIMVAGADEKPIKVALEGQPLIKNKDQEDWSQEIQVFQKLGVNVMHTNQIGVYVDNSLS